ncbi:hypothetical protein BKA65DRAFT_162355 [Rhexocercosporidium sp. MPI-PUGE-AT-0058]|nr:hypothetical protein BKA65DRAFT_162355 [Rhexocercosporidium sp. MPI-PUGE-AT-0058]
MGQSGSSPAEEATRAEDSKPTDSQATKSPEMKAEDLPSANAKLILVTGAARAGKTALIRLATGLNLAVANVIHAGTVACQIYTANIQGTELAFIDCPGLNGDNDDLLIIGSIARYLCNLFRQGRSLHGILYLHDISNGQVTTAMRRCLRFIEVITEEAGYPNIAFVTTKWDGLTETRRTAYDDDHNNLTNCPQWQPFRSNGARDTRHYGLDDLPNLPNVALQTADESLLNVLQFYLNNPNQMPLHLETKFNQSNQDMQSTIEWLLSSFSDQQNTNGDGVPKELITIAILAVLTGATLYQMKKPSYLRTRPTLEGKDQMGFRLYYEPNKDAKVCESWTNDIYQQQRKQYPLLPEGRLSNLLKDSNPFSQPNTFRLNNPTTFPFDPNAARSFSQRSTPNIDNPSYLNQGGRQSASGLNSNPSLFNFDSGGLSRFSSSDRSNFYNLNSGSNFTRFNSGDGDRFSSNGLNF